MALGIYTQNQLAERLGVKPWTLSKTLRGRRRNPHVLKKLERFLGEKAPASKRAA